MVGRWHRYAFSTSSTFHEDLVSRERQHLCSNIYNFPFKIFARMSIVHLVRFGALEAVDSSLGMQQQKSSTSWPHHMFVADACDPYLVPWVDESLAKEMIEAALHRQRHIGLPANSSHCHR